MKIGAPLETAEGERRVALTPETAGRLAAAGHHVLVQAGAGERAGFPDEAYAAAGVDIVPDPALGKADLVVRVQKPDPAETALLKSGAILVGLLIPRINRDLVALLARQHISALSMDLVPRIARAQRMDVLSSQSSLAGYKAVLMAANSQGKFFPMLMTAAGTIPPARVLVLGAGVAGLQAIATARRLGAVVEAFDVRPIVKEQVESLGARFVDVPQIESAEAAGGYAREQTEEEQAQQRQVLQKHISDADVVISTALIPGRPAPRLVPREAVAAMRPGSVIVDLAAEAGGNCELTKPGEVVTEHRVTIHGPLNVPSLMAHHASQMYSRNVAALLELIIDADGNPVLNFDDEVIDAICFTHAGQSRHGYGEGTTS